jgi:beta-aspartyl-dipeptidase (metallo-type)
MFHLIKNADIYAPEPLGLGHILVVGNRIAYLGRAAPSLDDDFDVTEVDADGAIVAPGLIDGHAHITGGGGESGPASRVPPVVLSSFTTAGVTSVVGLLGTDDLTRDTRSLVTQVYGLRSEGLSAWCHTGGYHLPLTTLTGSARGDIVFLEPVIGIGEVAISDHRSSQPTLDELLRLASEAHVAGLMTGKAGILHLHLGDGPRALSLVHDALERSEIPPRVFNPTHVNRNKALFEESLAYAERGCTIDLTTFPRAQVAPGWSAAEAFLRYRDGGYPPARLTISSDGGGCLPTFDANGQVVYMDVGRSAILAETLKELLDADVPAEQALAPFTANAARLLRLDRKGRLALGADADLVILDGAHGVRDVMARGRWHVRDGRPVVLGTFETADRQDPAF